MSLGLTTAGHPQTLLALHFNGQPLTVDHEAPPRLLVPVKLGLKNMKGITRITYVAEEQKHYWAERGIPATSGSNIFKAWTSEIFKSLIRRNIKWDVKYRR